MVGGHHTVKSSVRKVENHCCGGMWVPKAEFCIKVRPVLLSH